MVMISTYLLNLLCAMVPCQAKLPPPEISDTYDFNLESSRNLVNESNRTKRLLPETQNIFSNVFNPFDRRNSDSRKREANFPPLVAATNTGDLEGYYMKTMTGRRIVAFEGIPYAEVPVGNLRFKAPLPKLPWKGIRSAKKPGSPCLQAHPLNLFRISGSEDCLTLNIYTRYIKNKIFHGNNGNKTLPVLFFVHGGSFMFGHGAEYGPAYLLADADVILVTTNYRLGSFGFLSTGDAASPGNYGLKDQVLALKWVHDNIANFGGDPKRVTLMGQSAGGVSIHLHALSGKSNDYFRAGVSLSGSGFGHWPIVTPKRARMWTEKLAKRLNCPTRDNYSLVNCLRYVSASFITAAEQQIYDWIPFHPLVVFAPVVEPNITGAYITQSPAKAYENKIVNPVPWIFSFTSQEGHFETYLIKLFMQAGNVVSKKEKYLPLILDYIYSNDLPARSKITKAVLKYYLKNDSSRTMEAISEMYTDRFFALPVNQAIRAHSQIAPTYGYIFDYKGQYNLGTLFGIPKSEWGKSHTEDVFYFFNSSYFHHGLHKKDPEFKLSEIMVNTLANFITNGEPSYTDPNGKDMKIWEVATPTGVRVSKTLNDTRKLQILQFNEDIKMIDFPTEDRVKFWTDLAITY